MLASENVAKTFQQLLDIQEKYNKLSDEEKESVTNYSKVEKLLNPNDDSLNTEFVSQKTSSLKGKTIGYLGSSITVGFRSENVAFPDYIGKITGSTTVKQAITGGPLAKKEGVRDEVSYITQLEDNLSKNENLDALVVQLSTNDTTLGIEMGEVSSSQNKDDYDYSTVIGAMEYIIAYAKEKWNCPVIFYINPYLSDEVTQGTKDLFYIWWQELKAVVKDQGVLIFFILVPLGYPLLYTFIYTNETVREVPAAVVDNNRSSLSREYLRLAKM